MTQEEITSIKEYLLKEEIKITKRVIELKELTQPIEPDDAIGRVSRMDAIVNKSINQEALKKAATKLSKVKISLERIDDDNFGNCIQCNQPIPIQRLLLMPGSICIKCAH
jgi:RNA polymerase-binding transcription factor